MTIRKLPEPYLARDWAPFEDDVLRLYAKRGYSYGDVAKVLGRTRSSVAGRAHRLNVTFITDKKIDHNKRRRLRVEARWRAA